MDDYVEDVLAVVEQIPAGQVASYGDVAELVGRGGPRQVGQVMSRFGAAVPWWRVVRADGRPVRGLEDRALERLQAEGTPLRGDRVAMSRARYVPAAAAAGGADSDAPENAIRDGVHNAGRSMRG